MSHSRKLIAFLLALIMLLSLAACTNDNSAQTPDDDTSNTGNLPDNDNTSNPDDGQTSDEEPNTDTDPAEDSDPAEDVTPDGQDDADDVASDVDLAGFFDTLGETYEMAATGDMDETLSDSYLPGLSDIALRQSVLKTAMITAAVCEILLVECENSEDVATVEEIFNARVQAQVDGGAWYPASIATWEKAQIVTVGNYVALFADENAAAMAEDFRALFAE